MPEKLMTFGEMDEVLQKARQVYGSKNQIMVCMEELNELSCVLAKFPRYEDEQKATQELHDRALDEVADVYTILEHVKAIFGLTEEEILQRRMVKVDRVKTWLSHSRDMRETVDDRVLNDPCKQCLRDRRFAETYNNYCVHCLKAQATEGNAPFQLTKTE